MLDKDKIIQVFKKHYFIYSLMGILISIGIYIWIDYLSNKNFTFSSSFLELGKGVFSNIIPTIIIASLSFFLLDDLKDYFTNKKDLELIDKISNNTNEILKKYLSNNCKIVNGFHNVDWEYYFNNSKKITIATHYLSSWVSTRQSLIESFFKDDKTLEIILPKCTNNKKYRNIIEERFQDNRNISDKIDDCKTKFNSIKSSIGNLGNLNIFESKYFHWYFFMICDEKYLIISPYEVKVIKASIEAPAICIDIAGNEYLKEWIKKEVEHLKIN